MISITIDTNEKCPDIIAGFNQHEDVDIKFAHLTAGDYLVNNKWLFERKTLVDFSQSIIDGRLFEQALKLIHARERGILLLEGAARDLKYSSVRREVIQGALIKLAVVLKIPVLRAIDPAESVKLMLFVARQFNGLTEGNLLQRRKISLSKGKRKSQLYILQSLPGVGFKRAKILLEKFGSVATLMQADSMEVAETPGIGKAVAEKIHWVVNDTDKKYQLSQITAVPAVTGVADQCDYTQNE